MNWKNIGISIIAVIAVAIGILIWRMPSTTPPQTACTMEAKICPDGSAVGRTGPNCEFTPCPLDNAGWKTITANGVSFQYPDPLPTIYMQAQEWPPTIAVTNGALTCVAKKIINGIAYCVTFVSDSAAGSTYTTYSYATEKDGMILTLSFILRAVQCMNYDNPQQTACLKERMTFDIDALADKIIQKANIVQPNVISTSKTSVSKSDWITATSQKLGIRFEYPADALVSPVAKRQTPDGTTIYMFIVTPKGMDPTVVHFFSIKTSLEQAKNIQFYQSNISNSNFSNVTIDGRAGIQRIDRYSNNDCTNELAIVEKNEVVYGSNIVQCPTHPSGYDQLRRDIANSIKLP